MPAGRRRSQRLRPGRYPTQTLLPMRIPVLFLAFLAAAMCARAATPRPPNVIFFLIDDWGWTDAACFGSKLSETPNIDRLAALGTKFTQAYSAVPFCTPTR